MDEKPLSFADVTKPFSTKSLVLVFRKKTEITCDWKFQCTDLTSWFCVPDSVGEVDPNDI